MDEMFFNIENPFEKEVGTRLDQYLQQGTPHDVALERIGRDFPYIDPALRDNCEKAAYIHHYSGTDDKIAASIKQVVLLHSECQDEPFYSHQGHSFRVKEGEDVIVGVLMENPLYLYDKANVHLSVHIGGKKVNEFWQTMGMEDRRNVYYIPLNLNDNDILKTDCISDIYLDVVNEHIQGNTYSLSFDVYNGWKDAGDFFTLTEFLINDNSCGNRDSYDLESLDQLDLYAELAYNGGLGEISKLEGRYSISSSDFKDQRKILTGSIYLSRSFSHNDSLEGFQCMFKTDSLETETGCIPLFKPEAGKYIVNFLIWDTIIKSVEIELTESDELPEFDELLDDFIREMEMEEVKEEKEEQYTKPSILPDVNPEEYIEVIGMNLFNIDSDKDDTDRCLDNINRSPQTSFAADGLKMLSVIGKFKKHQDAEFLTKNYIFRWFIYDQTGRMVEWKCAKNIDVQNELWIYAAFGDFCSQNWEKGTYRLELQMRSKRLINAVFTVGEIDVTSEYEPKLISRKDNTVKDSIEGNALARLEKMAGLEKVKEKVKSLVNSAKLQKMRSEAGLPVKQPCLHARFLGNPGTGKTTVARLLGQIYKEMGILSSGHVVLEERKSMIGRYYDSESQAVENALHRAEGGILLIDEAYNLYVENDEKDPGRRILEYLLTALSDENNRDWMLILAGYPQEMERMLSSNPGIKSRVEEIFEFEDLDVDALMQVAELFCDDNRYDLTEEARKRLRSVITKDHAAKDKDFGNGRYVKKLMETAINTRMATRLSKIDSPTFDQLVTIEADDIPISAEEAERISFEGFDDAAIDEALKRLDSLVGLGKVKSAIHNFVNVSRFLNSQGEKIRGKGLLKWNFTGNTGTGKSTVAQILADILKAMNLIHNNEITEIKGEEIFNVSDYECNEVIRSAVKRSRKGLLFIDGDAPEFRTSQYRMSSEQVRFKLATLASEENSSGALIIAECSTPNLSIAHSLASNGIYDFDHIFIFDDYSEDELYRILLQCLEKYDTKVSDKAETIIREYIHNLCTNRELSFANARTMKNLSRAIFETMILRLSQGDNPEAERIVSFSDVKSFVWKGISGKIGFKTS